MKKKPTTPRAVRQLQTALVTVGKAVRQLQRRMERLERRDRIIKGFGPVDCSGFQVESDDNE